MNANGIKNFGMSIVVIFMIFMFSVAAGAQSVATPTPCGIASMPVCETVSFIGTDNEDDPAIIVTQRLEIDESTRTILSDRFFMDYMEGMNSVEDNMFVVVGDATEAIEDSDYLQDVDAFRAIVGESDMIYRGQDAILIIVVHEGYTYIFVTIGSMHGFFDYVEEVVLDDDITVPMDGFIPVESSESLSIISNTR